MIIFEFAATLQGKPVIDAFKDSVSAYSFLKQLMETLSTVDIEILLLQAG